MPQASEAGSREYSRRVYAVPFGRYEGAKPVAHDGAEVLIGRERERARMLDWLLTLGGRGAYLVTGYRGVGKTSFVNFCLRRYDEDIYGRWLQCSVGRALFWDRCLIVAVLIALPTSLLFAAQIVDILSSQNIDSHVFSLCRWLIVAMLALLPFYPFAYAFSMLRVALRLSPLEREPADSAPTDPSKPSAPWPKTAGHWLLKLSPWLLAVIAIVRLPMFASPPASVAFFIAALTWTYAACHAFSISRESQLLKAPGSAGFSRSGKWSRRLSTGTTILGTLGLLAFCVRGSLKGFEAFCLVLAPANVAVGFALRWYDSQALSRFIAEVHRSELKDWSTLRHKLANRHAIVVAVSTAVIFLFSRIYGVDADGWRLLSALLPIALCSAGILYRHSRLAFSDLSSQARSDDPRMATTMGRWYHFHPRPRLLLSVKGLFALVLGLQVMPALARFGYGPLLDHLLRRPEHCSRSLGIAGAAICYQRFPNSTVELHWIALVVAFACCLLYLEDDWLVRRHSRARRDGAYDPEPPEANQYAGSRTRMGLLLNTREFSEATTFFSIFRTWLPLLTIRVNLGFDELNHSHVVTSMLVGLRDEYHRVFISLRSRLGFLASVSWNVLLVFAAVVLGNLLEAWFSDFNSWLTRDFFRLTIPGAAGAGAQHLLSFVVPCGLTSYGSQAAIAFHLSHAAGFLGLLVASRIFGQRIRPFRETYARLDAIAESTTSTVRRGEVSRLKFAAAGVAFDGPERTHQRDTAPQEPHAIEQHFLNVLRDVLVPYVGLPLQGHVLSLPAPQITFVFDELDKVGVRSAGTVEGQVEYAGISADHERSRRVHRLLADMKNVLSVAPARFIFVGGRDLHDEWLADQTARQPLLSNIFDAEVYLPTLLVDPLGDRGFQPANLTRGIHAYMNAQRRRALALNDNWERGRLGLQLFDVGRHHPENFFVQPTLGWQINASHGPPVLRESPSSPSSPSDQASAETVFAAWPLYDASDWSGPETKSISWKEGLLQQLSQYLAFRGRGNPKRLDAFLEGLIKPTGRVVENRALRWNRFDCQHVIRFDYERRFSIQLVAAIYSRIAGLVVLRASHGDDKNVRSVFYLADFLMKFHRRAFSWSSLERIDEVLHVHRAPDLRGLLEELIWSWAQSFVQPVMSGMQSFRFRSDLSAEIRYVSRLSEPEMAAYNFTLDESQEHKREYQRRISKMQADEAGAFIELRSGLGELHDFDEDYEEARRHYLEAIRSLDLRREQRVKGHEGDGGSDEGRAREIEWGVARLRLMLQIGMTYERGRSYERALVEYRSARSLARSIWKIMLDAPNVAKDSAPHLGPAEPQERGRWLDTLKYLFVLYEPLFAMAWVTEKAPTAIDVSNETIDAGLMEIRARTEATNVETAKAFGFANSVLHHNAGNLNFFKGRYVSLGRSKIDHLHEAHCNYACALHEMRNACHRSDQAHSGGAAPNLPELVLRRASASLFGLADACLAQISLPELLEGKVNHFEPPQVDEFAKWLASSDSVTVPAQSGRVLTSRNYEALGSLKGASKKRARHASELLELSARVPAQDRLQYFRWASWLGAELLEKAGLYEESGNELLRIGTCVDGLIGSLSAYGDMQHPQKSVPGPLCGDLLQHGVKALNKARDLLEGSQAASISHGGVNGVVPQYAKRLARTLGLAAARCLKAAKSTDEVRQASQNVQALAKIADAWRDDAQRSVSPLPKEMTADEMNGLVHIGKAVEYRNWFRKELTTELARNVFPVLNHLITLHSLILDEILAGSTGEKPQFLSEIRRLEQEYASPLHFTPFHLGVILALEVLEARRLEAEALEVRAPEAKALEAKALEAKVLEAKALECDARRHLERSQQMYTGRAAYYEVISNLYHLDDDFNDRCIHVRHGLQMMGAELTQLLLRKLEKVAQPQQGNDGAQLGEQMNLSNPQIPKDKPMSS